MTCGLYDTPQRVAAAQAHQGPACADYADDFGHFRRAGYEVVFSAFSKAER